MWYIELKDSIRAAIRFRTGALPAVSHIFCYCYSSISRDYQGYLVIPNFYFAVSRGSFCGALRAP